jgi:hypothetical protein
MPRSTFPLRALAALTLTVALGGCNAKTAANDPTDKARTTVETFMEACGHRETDAVAELLTEDTRTKFIEGSHTAESCAKVLGIPPEGGTAALEGAFSTSRVTAAESNGGYASVTVEIPDRGSSTVELEEVRGRWYVSNPLG